MPYASMQVLAALFDSRASASGAQKEASSSSAQQEGPPAKRQRGAGEPTAPAAASRQHTRLETPFKEFKVETIMLFLQVVYDGSTVKAVAGSLYCNPWGFGEVRLAVHTPVWWVGWAGLGWAGHVT